MSDGLDGIFGEYYLSLKHGFIEVSDVTTNTPTFLGILATTAVKTCAFSVESRRTMIPRIALAT
jgi:hypothetical protein